MTAAEIVDHLTAWTPYLLVGFGWNIGVSLLAMAIGTAIGLFLAIMRDSSVRGMKGGGGALTMVMHGAPTFVMLFYLTYLVPGHIELLGASIHVPVWSKASLAFGIAVTGFVSDNALVAIRHLARGRVPEALLFLPSWTNYFLIIVMASSTASVIGVPELVYRARTVIGAVDRPDFSIWIYLYIMVWFLLFGIALTAAMHVLRDWLTRRAEAAPDEAGRGGVP